MDSVTVAECFALFADEWVCLEVLDEDDAGQTQRGRVIAHSSHKVQSVRQEMDFRRTHPGVTTHLFFAGPLVDPKADAVVIL